MWTLPNVIHTVPVKSKAVRWIMPVNKDLDIVTNARKKDTRSTHGMIEAMELANELFINQKYPWPISKTALSMSPKEVNIPPWTVHAVRGKFLSCLVLHTFPTSKESGDMRIYRLVYNISNFKPASI